MSHVVSDVVPSEGMEPADVLRLNLLGSLRLSRDGSDLDISSPKRRALLILLALNVGVPVSLDRIVDALWPDRKTGREDSTLRVHISQLRDEIEPSRSGPPHVIVTRGSAYMLVDEAVEIDIVRFHRLAQEGHALLATETDTSLELLNEALGLWHGHPLLDVEYEEFAQEAIRRLEVARIEAIEDRAEALVELGEESAAIDDLEVLIRTEATRERPVRLLMLAYHRTGRQAESLRVARRHARQLAERGLEPSPAVRDLEERILQHDADLLPVGTVSPADIKPGRSVRGYELREEVGVGSIGVVYRAYQSSVGRMVALKAVDPRLAGTPEFTRRFTEEARVVAGLEHPHIVPTYDFWRDPAGAFLVMRWMGGGNLADRLDHPWEKNDLGRVFDHLADALGYAHGAGIVHRDVRPSNVLFDATGNVYLCDFGLAVTGIDTGGAPADRLPASSQAYTSPELLSAEGPTVASDVYGLGVLLAEAASGGRFRGIDTPLDEGIREVVLVATASNPADRYPDMAAFRSALANAIGRTTAPAPRRVRRNPYKGLAPFDEGDRADFYGRDDVTETLVDVVGSNTLTAVIGASGSGKSSIVMAGLVPELRDGALPGSDEWSIVRMVPGTEPFEEFHLRLRSAAVGRAMPATHEGFQELRDAFAAALDGPNSSALLVVDQFEEVFSSEVDEVTRSRFLDNLVDLALDPTRRIRVVLALRADFSDQALAHPQLGNLIVEGSVLLASMRPEQVEDVIRRPSARVGVQVEPGLIAEIVRDISSAPAYLPLLQYVLAELFERRVEDRLTVQAYRSLGGVQGVLERRAEATYSAQDVAIQRASRQLFLRMVHIGDQGEQTRRRLPLTELRGLRGRAEVENALEAFTAVRLLTYDRDPVTRTPTVEIAHETVISNWVRYRIWIEETRADILSHRRLSAAAARWAESGEDASYLLMEGPLVAALDLVSGDRISLNELETRFVFESRCADEERRQIEMDRRRREAIAAAQERQNIARELAAASVMSLTAADPGKSLRLAVAAADQSLEAGEDVLPEVTDALHLALINPRPDLIIEGAGFGVVAKLLSFARDGSDLLLALASDGDAMIIDSHSGEEVGRVHAQGTPAFGVDFHPRGDRIITIHRDGVRQWDWRTGALESEFERSGEISAGTYSSDGSRIAIGRYDGVIRVFDATSTELISDLEGHTGRVASIDFDPSGDRLVSGSYDTTVRVWNITTDDDPVLARVRIVLPVSDVAWHPQRDVVAVATWQGEMFLFDPASGERINSFGNGQDHSRSVAFDSWGALVIAAGEDGFARIFGTTVGGEATVVLPTGGVPIGDAVFNPSDPSAVRVTTVGVDGTIRIWSDMLGSELPARQQPLSLYPHIAATPAGDRYLFGRHALAFVLPEEAQPQIEVFDAETGRLLISRDGHKDWDLRRKSAISADGSLIAFAGSSGDVEIVGVDTGATTTIPQSKDWAVTLAFNTEATLLAGCGTQGTIRIWSVATGTLTATLVGHGDREPRHGGSRGEDAENLGVFNAYTERRVHDVAFRPCGTDLASAGLDGTVRVWDPVMGEGRVIHEFDYGAPTLAYSPDGLRIAAADTSGTVVLLDADTGTVVARPDRVSGTTWLVFSCDGRYLAGAGPGLLVHLWSMETGRLARRIRGAVYPPFGAAFVNGGTELRVASGEGIDRGYLLDPIDLVDLARSEAPGGLTEEECRQYLSRPCAG